MKEIKLNKGFATMVDDSDYDWLNQWSWFVSIKNHTCYVYRRVKIDGKMVKIWMHRLILNTPDGIESDHKDHNGLNNQRDNLRNATHSQNNKNKTPRGKSKYLGVYYNGKHIRAQINIGNIRMNLGNFKTEEEAALAYDKAAKAYHGEFANLNIR